MTNYNVGWNTSLMLSTMNQRSAWQLWMPCLFLSLLLYWVLMCVWMRNTSLMLSTMNQRSAWQLWMPCLFLSLLLYWVLMCVWMSWVTIYWGGNRWSDLSDAEERGSRLGWNINWDVEIGWCRVCLLAEYYCRWNMENRDGAKWLDEAAAHYHPQEGKSYYLWQLSGYCPLEHPKLDLL